MYIFGRVIIADLPYRWVERFFASANDNITSTLSGMQGSRVDRSAAFLLSGKEPMKWKRFWGGHKSNSEILRLFEQGEISLNGQTLREAERVIEVCNGDVFHAGKRTWFRLRVDRL